MPFPSNGFARLAAKAGARKRWANATPEDRRRQGEVLRAGLRKKNLDRAAAMAPERGLSPSQDDLERAARALAEADLAEARLKAWNALQGSKGGES
jgi:hypothetical protein